MTDDSLAAAVAAVEGRVFIGLKTPAQSAGVDARGRKLISPAEMARGLEMLRASGHQIIYEFELFPTVIATVPPSAVPGLRHHPRVDYLEPVVTGEWATLKEDPLAGMTNGANLHGIASGQTIPDNMFQIDAPSTWPLSRGEGVEIVIMDSGVMSNHPDLLPSFAYRCDNVRTVEDTEGHGTHVAGIAAAIDNSEHVVGAANGVILNSANVADENDLPDNGLIACSIEIARLNGIFAVNMSIATSPSTAITDQIRGGYYQDGMIFAAATGNNGPDVRYPANLDETIAVGSVDSDDGLSSFSNTGPEVDLVAPGRSILSTTLPDGVGVCAGKGSLTGVCTGTSMAAPHVTAAAALLKARFPSWTNTQIADRLFGTALDLGPTGHDSGFGHGRLDVFAAISMSAQISGGFAVETLKEETWSAHVTGGISPFSYEWRVDDVVLGTEETFSYTRTTDQKFELSLQVTGSDGEQDGESKSITVFPPFECDLLGCN